MPDKIVNHFVLADGSTAKYDATQLAGDVPEVVDIRTGYDGTVYASAGDAVRGQVSDLNSTLSIINDELSNITGTINPPPFAIGGRYVNNGVDTWANNNARMSFKQGTYIKLSQGDIVNKSDDIYVINGGYSTDNGNSFISIPSTTSQFIAPADGIYFFCLAKRNEAIFAEDEIEIGYTYITFTKSAVTPINTQVIDVENNINAVKETIDYEIVPIEPSDYLDFPNTNKGLSYMGELVDDNGQDSTDYIEIDNLYDIFRIVQYETKYGLGAICYYTKNKQFIRRDLLGTNYDFSIYNGEKGVWLNVDKTTANAKYIRYCADNNRGFKYWEVDYGAKAAILDDYAKHKFTGKKIVNFGDSIFGQTRPPKDVSSYLANLTGATVYNAGFGGCEMSTHADSNYNPFSMCNLADAIASGDWSAQEAGASASGMPAYFSETVTMLENIDFTTIDIITISYGTNDWNNSTPLDNGGNTNKTYFADALRYSLETILTAFPNLKVFVCTPIYRFFMNSQGDFVDDSNTHVNSTTNTKLTDFVEKTIEVASEYQVPCINNYEIGMNKYTKSYYFYSYDGTHPKPTGNQLIADNIANKIF